MSDTIQRFPLAPKEEPYPTPEVSFNADISPTSVFIAATVDIKGGIALELLRLALRREVARILHDHEQAYKSAQSITAPENA